MPVYDGACLLLCKRKLFQQMDRNCIVRIHKAVDTGKVQIFLRKSDQFLADFRRISLLLIRLSDEIAHFQYDLVTQILMGKTGAADQFSGFPVGDEPHAISGMERLHR